ncbi:MAG TPA: hypothetical protein VL068_02040 [Microthrixaceae bacterium]|nr:hypothetical protein [Microthrixaceae bacterium]
MTSLPIRIAIFVASFAALAGCSSQSIDNETRLIEVHGERAYLCLSNAINDSFPPSCGAKIDTKDNPELHGPKVAELIRELDGTNQSIKLTASEEDGKWILADFVKPE